MKTFSRPLVKYGGKALDSMFNAKGYREVGDVFRDKLGGSPFPITRDPKPRTQWFCDASGCTRYTDYDGENHGTCAGYCMYF